VSATAIRPAPAPPAPAARPDGSGYLSPFAGAAANSRSSFGLPGGELAPRWTIDLPPSLQPRFVLHDRNRILLCGREWMLLEAGGRVIASGPAAGWPVTLDMARGLFYHMAAGGRVAAARAADGVAVFTFLPAQGDVFSRKLIARRGARILVAGAERDLTPRDAGPPARLSSALDAVDLTDPVKTSSMGTLRPAAPQQTLSLPWPNAVFAANDRMVAAAAPGRIYIIDWNLQVARTLDAPLQPTAMSLDETGRIYLALKRIGKPDALWVVTPEGALVSSFEFPRETAPLLSPPIVTWNHGVYLVAGTAILALDAALQLKWIRSTQTPLAGAVALPDGSLLASEGAVIALWDAAGERSVVYDAVNEAFEAPPAPVATGDLLAATANHLYCLATRLALR
jgi:hypothetical protein